MTNLATKRGDIVYPLHVIFEATYGLEIILTYWTFELEIRFTCYGATVLVDDTIGSWSKILVVAAVGTVAINIDCGVITVVVVVVAIIAVYITDAGAIVNALGAIQEIIQTVYTQYSGCS